MNSLSIYFNIITFISFGMLFVAFFAAERTREMDAWKALLLDLTIWSGSVLFMRLDIFPGYVLWFYITVIALYSAAFLVYNYAFQLANEKDKLHWNIWIVGTGIIILAELADFFIAPPEKVLNGNGNTDYLYSIDWKAIIPVVFFLLIIVSIIRVFKKLLRQNISNAPGVIELITGGLMLIAANILLIIPGNMFPWDMLVALIFVAMISASLHRRQLFNTTRMISSSVLIAISGILCVIAASVIFPRLSAFCEKNYNGIASGETIAFIFLSIILTVSIHGFRQLLAVIFRDTEKQTENIKKYSEAVSGSLNVEEIMTKTILTVRSELHVNQVIICKLEGKRFMPKRSASILYYPTDFSISIYNPYLRGFNNGDNRIMLKDFGQDYAMNEYAVENKALAVNNIDIIMALKDGERVVGLILIGQKKKNSAYSFSDFAFLNTVCSVVSMALKNASLYEQVAEREKLFSGMTAFIPNIILIKQKNDPYFCFVSSNTNKILGLDREAFSVQAMANVLNECVGQEMAEKIVYSFDNAPMGGSSFEIPFIRPDDKTVHTIRCVFSPIVMDGVISHYVCVLSDISEDIEARELLKSSALIAQNSNKAKSEFLSQMSHEIRTPMNSIAGLTYLARENIKGTDPELSEYIDRIDESTNYLLSLLNNIMDMSRIENSQFEINKQPFDVVKVLDEVDSVYSVQMQVKNISLEYITEDLSYKNVIGDEIALRKILNNLLSNAYKYTPESGKVGFYVTERSITAQSIILHFEISDNGSGISKEYAEKIFEPYTQDPARIAENGSGLGMAICKNIVDLQGGQISVTSEVGIGTKFTVDIPYAVGEAEEKQPETEARDYSVLGGKHIMVVDDVEINTVITKKLLEKHGVIVDCASDGRQAVELFESKDDNYYDCILMDIQMPEMDGFETAAEIRSKDKSYAPHIPIIALTADAFLTDSANADRSNFAEFIIKPVSPDSLYSKLAGFLE